MQIADPHKSVALDAVPDHILLQAEQKRAAGYGIDLVHQRIGALERAFDLVIFRFAFRKNAFDSVFSLVKIQANETEARFAEAQRGELREAGGKIPRRMIVRGVFYAERRDRLGKRFSEADSDRLAVCDIMGEDTDTAA